MVKEMRSASENGEKVEGIVLVVIVIIVIVKWQLLVGLLSQSCWIFLTLVWLAIANSSMGLYTFWSS